jgi:hypothetical protein
MPLCFASRAVNDVPFSHMQDKVCVWRGDARLSAKQVGMLECAFLDGFFFLKTESLVFGLFRAASEATHILRVQSRPVSSHRIRLVRSIFLARILAMSNLQELLQYYVQGERATATVALATASATHAVSPSVTLTITPPSVSSSRVHHVDHVHHRVYHLLDQPPSEEDYVWSSKCAARDEKTTESKQHEEQRRSYVLRALLLGIGATLQYQATRCWKLASRVSSDQVKLLRWANDPAERDAALAHAVYTSLHTYRANRVWSLLNHAVLASGTVLGSMACLLPCASLVTPAIVLVGGGVLSGATRYALWSMNEEAGPKRLRDILALLQRRDAEEQQSARPPSTEPLIASSECFVSSAPSAPLAPSPHDGAPPPYSPV